MLQRFTVRRRKKGAKKLSLHLCELFETTDACVLLESILCTLRCVPECLEIGTGVAKTFSDFDFRFASISHAGPFQNVTTEVTEICRDYTLLTPVRHEQVL